MARPKGSKNKPKVEPFDPSKLDQEVKEVMSEKVKSGDLMKEVVENIEFVEPIPYDKRLDKIDEAYSKAADKYNPFSNPLFNKKMGLKDK